MGLRGVADLPLHGGRVPAWLALYMRRLAEAIVEAIVELYSPEVLVERLADPFWFQAFNNAIGMDWDSSGSTTVTTGILKQVTWSRPELGVVVLGGKGVKARLVPDEAPKAAELGVIDDALVDEIVYASRLAAKTDNVLIDDGYTLYHHTVLASKGRWAIIQQGMDTVKRYARRYHWLSPLNHSQPSLEPHTAIVSAAKRDGIAYDLTSRISLEARKAIPEIVSSTSPRRMASEILSLWRMRRGDASLDHWLGNSRGSAWQPRRMGGANPRYYVPQHAPPQHIEKVLERLYRVKPSTIEELALAKGVGPSTLRSLVLVAELVYGIPVSHEDPASAPIDPFRYAYVAGGKDGVPFPFQRDYAEAAIEFLRSIVEEARVDEKSRRRAMARLEKMALILSESY